MSSQDLNHLNQHFAIASHVRFIEGPGGLVIAEIANTEASASIALQGAHIMTFQPKGQEPVIWLSKFAKFAAGKSIRGGAPVCWPWFGPHATDASLPGHGYARTVMWQVLETRATADGETVLRFGLIDNDSTRAQWPHASSAELTVTVGAALRIELATRNDSPAGFVLGEALHTYFHISDVADMKISGLDGCDFLDKVDGFSRKKQQGPVSIESEVDRVYINVPGDCLIEDQGFGRRIRIASENARSVVVWNPWTEKADKMGDFGPNGHRGMVCVETANALENVVTVAPGETHRMVATYSVEKM
ncbi:MAG: D-hexose-6-phosphate mutarotase [Sulfuricellaceae bacterium]|nr:D-hexose-6-phosphate mutarotase [Sulfuricellaceae bacterium]